MTRDDISISNVVTTGRRGEEQARLEGKAPSTEQQGREKEADDFNLTLQESDVFVELIEDAIKKFGGSLPKQLWIKGRKVEKKLMKFGAVDPSLEPDRIGHWATFGAFCLEKDIVLRDTAVSGFINMCVILRMLHRAMKEGQRAEKYGLLSWRTVKLTNLLMSWMKSRSTGCVNL